MADLMSATTDCAKLQNKYGNYVVPAIKIKSSGSDLVSTLGLTVSELQITLSVESVGMTIIKIADAYDIEKSSFNSKIKNAFKLGTIIQIEIGYLSATEAVFKGYVAGLGAEFGEVPFLVVKLMVVRKLMMTSGVRRQLYTDKNYSDIFKKVMGNYSKLCSVVCDATSDNLVSPVSQSTSDYNFVTNELISVGKSDREFFVLLDKAYFRTPAKNKTPIMKLELGKELLDFEIMADYLDTEINVVGYDPKNCKDISTKVKAKTPEKYTPVLTPTPEQFYFDADADTEAKTKLRAQALARIAAQNVCYARGKLVGIPEIVPGRYLQIEKLDEMANKKYYISEVVHNISESHFFTFFESKGWI